MPHTEMSAVYLAMAVQSAKFVGAWLDFWTCGPLMRYCLERTSQKKDERDA